ncbi:hypothetical protein [Spirosoma areae]
MIQPKTLVAVAQLNSPHQITNQEFEGSSCLLPYRKMPGHS